jgi:hypothetical protein
MAIIDTVSFELQPPRFDVIRLKSNVEGKKTSQVKIYLTLLIMNRMQF